MISIRIVVLVFIASASSFSQSSNSSLEDLLTSSFKKRIDYLKENKLFEDINNEQGAYKLYNKLKVDLSYISNLRFSKKSRLFKEFFKADLNSYLLKHIGRIGWDSSLSGERGAVASASGYYEAPSISFGLNYIKDHFSTVERVGTIVHEAHHNTLDAHGHIICPNEFLGTSTSGLRLANLLACEKNYNGSYGAQVVFFQNISKFCINCSEKDKRIAASLALKYSERIINKKALEQILKD